mmetsp:Transcript_43104/g.82206  ORF Transcript_43104/g.82206 Transcript_43104/m.82206 type:complete len:609 (+) Transcript_43104:247-2073(+)
MVRCWWVSVILFMCSSSGLSAELPSLSTAGLQAQLATYRHVMLLFAPPWCGTARKLEADLVKIFSGPYSSDLGHGVVAGERGLSTSVAIRRIEPSSLEELSAKFSVTESPSFVLFKGIHNFTLHTTPLDAVLLMQFVENLARQSRPFVPVRALASVGKVREFAASADVAVLFVDLCDSMPVDAEGEALRCRDAQQAAELTASRFVGCSSVTFGEVWDRDLIRALSIPAPVFHAVLVFRSGRAPAACTNCSNDVQLRQWLFQEAVPIVQLIQPSVQPGYKQSGALGRTLLQHHPVVLLFVDRSEMSLDSPSTAALKLLRRVAEIKLSHGDAAFPPHKDVTLQNSSAFLQPSTQSGDQIYHPEAAAISEQQSSGGKTSEGIAKPLVFFYADGGSNSSLGYFPHHVGVRKLPSVVILDPVHETQHVMSTTISEQNLKQFFSDFVQQNLGHVETSEDRFNRGLKHASHDDAARVSSAIRHISAATFVCEVLGCNDPPYQLTEPQSLDQHEHLNVGDMDILVLFTVPWCAFCQRVAMIAEVVASSLPSKARLVVIDCQLNTCTAPTAKSNITVAVYPTFMLYPACNKQKPVRYTRDWGARSLLTFVQDGSETC